MFRTSMQESPAKDAQNNPPNSWNIRNGIKAEKVYILNNKVLAKFTNTKVALMVLMTLSFKASL